MGKNKKAKWYCIDCGYTETNCKQMDGCRCPKCGKGLWVCEKVTADG